MDYPQDFPAESRAKVEAARIRARRRFDVAIKRPPRIAHLTDRKVSGIPTAELIFWDYVLTPWFVFVKEAYRLRLWSVDVMKNRCEEALRHFVIEAYYHKGKGIVAKPTDELGGIRLKIKLEIEKKTPWRKYENLLLKLAEESPIASYDIGLIERNLHLFGDGPLVENLPSPAPNAESKPAKVSDGNTREIVLRPILSSKGLSVHDWAKGAGVDFHTANRYLKGKIKPHASTLKKLADALGVEVDKLPA
jgi:Helix-turn-helix